MITTGPNSVLNNWLTYLTPRLQDASEDGGTNLDPIISTIQDQFEYDGEDGEEGDTTAPNYVGANVNGLEDVAVDADIELYFNENVFEGSSGYFVIYNAADSNTPVEAIAASDATFTDNTVTIDPIADLTAGENYFVRVQSNAVEDEAGNVFPGFGDSSLLNFTTADGSGINTVAVDAGTTEPVAATDEADVFSFDAGAALAMADNTQIQITGFDTAADSLQLDITTAGGVDTLDELDGIDGIAVQSNVITDITTINFGADANGDVVALQLVGITDATEVQIEAI